MALVRRSLILIFGGTFDPVHLGHIAIARSVRALVQPDRFILMPNAIQPLRTLASASFADRVAMLRLASAGENFEIDEREAKRERPSFSFDTLSALRAELGEEVALAWLVGGDAFARFDQWHRWQELFDLAHWIVVDRPGLANDQTLAQVVQVQLMRRCIQRAESLREEASGFVLRLSVPRVDISATEVRRRCAMREATDDLLAPEVSAYISRHGLYAASNTG